MLLSSGGARVDAQALQDAREVEACAVGVTVLALVLTDAYDSGIDNAEQQMNAWTLASLSKARRENVLAALKIRAYLHAVVPYWQAEPYRAALRRHLAAARLYKVKALA